MTSIVDHLTRSVSEYSELAYLAVFLAALVEAAPVVGSAVPGTTIILALSALVASGGLKLSAIVAAAIIGAGLGDGLAFWLGHRAQKDILGVWPMSRYPRLVADSEAFFHRYGQLAVFFARFIAPIRAFVPITAGALGMGPRRFYPIDLTAVVLWALAHTLPGALAGSLLERYGVKLEHYGLPLAVTLVLIGLALWLVSRTRKQAAK